MNAQSKHDTLEEVLLQFSTEQDLPDERLLKAYVSQYPEFERELLQCAAVLVQVRLRGDTEPVLAHDPVAEWAISRFHNLRFGAQAAAKAEPNVVAAGNPIARLDSGGYSELMTQLGVPSSFIKKLRDRQVLPNTIPAAFVKRLARLLAISISELEAHFRAPQQFVRLAFAQSSAGSEPPESFADALHSCGLDQESADRLLLTLSQDE
ncbi:hypothetical protein ACKI2N_015645 [Cupriavidus sp. 30B13]|uniref:hypothetical protein n=1 Tax=Cupriavidus sp. 30B13 TaxID=3384241 RepID=UPI003B913963